MPGRLQRWDDAVKAALALLLVSGVAFADEQVPPATDPPKPEPTPTTPPTTPTTPTPTPPTTTPTTTPTVPTTPAAGAPAPVEEEQPKGTYSKRVEAPDPTIGARPGTHIDDNGGAIDERKSPDKKPFLTAEASGAGAKLANQYIEYKGWTLKNGASKGFRLGATLMGIEVGYEFSSLANDQACDASHCISGSGSTTFHALDAGYHYRFGKIGPVRPFIAGTLTAVRANAGDWSSATANKTVWGGGARLGIGVEVPIIAKVYATGAIAYRLMVTENPLRDKDAENANTVLVTNGMEPANGDYAEDVHMIGAYVGVGVEL